MEINEVTDKIEEIKKSLSESVELAKNKLEEPVQENKLEEPVQENKLEEPVQENKLEELVQDHDPDFEELKKLLQSAQWPQAVDPSLICSPSSEQDKIERAEGILDIIVETPVKDKKFLDFGCGEGHVVRAAVSKGASLSIGYDIKKSENWSDNCTDDFSKIEENGPYDVVLMYDVIDHIIGFENQVDAMKKIKSLCVPETKIYARMHPFPSRHATHLYHTLNKAYVHLIFTEKELRTFCTDPAEQPSNRMFYPGKYYKDLFEASGFTALKSNIYKEPVENVFLKNPYLIKRIKECYKDSGHTNWIEGTEIPNPLTFQFFDFTLKV